MTLIKNVHRLAHVHASKRVKNACRIYLREIEEEIATDGLPTSFLTRLVRRDIQRTSAIMRALR